MGEEILGWRACQQCTDRHRHSDRSESEGLSEKRGYLMIVLSFLLGFWSRPWGPHSEGALPGGLAQS